MVSLAKFLILQKESERLFLGFFFVFFVFFRFNCSPYQPCSWCGKQRIRKFSALTLNQRTREGISNFILIFFFLIVLPAPSAGWNIEAPYEMQFTHFFLYYLFHFCEKTKTERQVLETTAEPTSSRSPALKEDEKRKDFQFSTKNSPFLFSWNPPVSPSDRYPSEILLSSGFDRWEGDRESRLKLFFMLLSMREEEEEEGEWEGEVGVEMEDRSSWTPKSLRPPLLPVRGAATAAAAAEEVGEERRAL